jgi:hypothetical protein
MWSVASHLWLRQNLMAAPAERPFFFFLKVFPVLLLW